ncbi:hypothetical protein MOQ21_00820 [Stenotrophomonas maltophilia]|nr:hypothetical protein [Stenotrophomonas maltophilia]MCI1126351.1 hypothetical protein [Stenotrophomonas maltophilia]
MAVSINKIQFLTNKASGNPIFYCHGTDVDHHPTLSAASKNGNIVISTEDDLLFKVKKNPQSKDRIDIYMSIEDANALGKEILALTAGTAPKAWPPSKANPHANASGNMALPNISESYFSKAIKVSASTDSGVSMSKTDCYVNIDVETPHATHIRMMGKEVHIGIALNASVGDHDPEAGFTIDVPVGELQTTKGETNPVQKVEGVCIMKFEMGVAAGLGLLLKGMK